MEKPIEIKEMPSQELLERFVSQIVLGERITVIFNCEEGVFEDHAVSHNPES